MRIEKVKIGNKEVMPLTIPSGIVMTDPRCAKRLLEKCKEIGVWTTKSIGENERIVPEGYEVINPDPNKEYGFRESILAQIDDGSLVNAVRLTNPGKDKMREYLLKTNIPSDRIINASVFGGSIREVVSVIKTLEGVVDTIEINGSCPHSEKGGMLIGLEPKTVYNFVTAAVQVTKKPVLFKITPNTTNENIGLIARAVKEAGGAGVVAINTVGPYIHYVDGHAVLTSKIGGGISGSRIKERGVECIRVVRKAVPDEDFLIFAMGGIRTARDVEDYMAARANVCGIGSALAGMNENELANYFPTIVSDLENGTNYAEKLLKKVDMNYKRVTIDDIIDDNCDFKVIKTTNNINAKPGQFVFAWLPGVGEKPFSIMDNSPLTLGILERGEFTKKFSSLKEGDYFYVRGPYGIAPSVNNGEEVALVGGGCGIAGLYLFAKQLSKKAKVTTLLAAKDKEHIPYIKKFENCGEVYIATEDGSLGRKGLVTDLLKEVKLRKQSYFLNCGPKAMVEAVLPLELKISVPERVYSSVDYMTRCGTGICGSCADEKGRRTCVEGPFMNL